MNLNLNIILDIALCAILAAAFLIGLKRGLLRSVWGLTALVIAIVLTGILRPFAVNSFNNSALAKELHSYVYNVVSDRAEDMLASAAGTVDDAKAALDAAYTLPEKYTEAAAEQVAASTMSAAASVTETVTDTVVAIASGVFLFVLIRLLLWIIFMILKFASTLPVLRETNRLAGGIVQMLIALALLYAVFAAAAVTGTGIFNDTLLCKFMYDNNLLLTVIGL